MNRRISPSHGLAVAILVLPTMFFAGPLVADPTWQPTPVGAKAPLRTWAAHADGTTLYAEAHRLLRSDDAGRSWRRIVGELDDDVTIFSSGDPFLHPTNPEIVVVEGTAPSSPDELTSSIVVSQDGGQTWTLRRTPARGLDPIGFDHRGRFFVGSGVEIHRTGDLGVTWTDVSLPPAFGDSQATTVALGDSAVGILGGNFGDWVVSTDGGSTYTARAPLVRVPPSGAAMAPYDARRWIVAVQSALISTRDAFATSEVLTGVHPEASRPQFHPRRRGWVFATYRSQTLSRSSAIAFSSDDGATWTEIEIPGGQPEADLIFDPCDDETWYVQRHEGDGFVRVSGAGVSVTDLDPGAPHRRTLSAVPRAEGCELLVETTGGLFAVGDQGAAWKRLGTGLAAPSAHRFVFDPHVVGRVYAATASGLAISEDHGRTWDWPPAFDGLGLDSLVVGSQPGHLAWLSLAGVLYRSLDDGVTSEIVDFPVRRILADPFAPDELLVQSGSLVWTRRGDLGETMLHVVRFDVGYSVDEIAFAPHEQDLAYTYSALDERFYVSRDGGETFETTAIVPNPLLTQSVRGLRVAGDGTIYLFGDLDAVRSRDGGVTFEPMPVIDAAPTASRLRDLVPDPHDPAALAAAVARNDGGELLLRSADRGATFDAWSTGAVLSVDGFGTVARSPVDANLSLYGGRTIQRRDDSTDACDSTDVLCLRDERFEVSLHFGAPADGTPDIARTVDARSLDSGLFTFFDADNWEVLVKVLDGCGLNDRFWVLAAATTDQAYTLRLTDRASGIVREYVNAPGRRSPAIIDTDAFASCDAATSAPVSPAAAPSIAASPAPSRSIDSAAVRTTATSAKVDGCPNDRLCLQEGRFEVAVRWRDTGGTEGDGQPVDVRSADSGLFTFFDPSNWELMVKVLDACDFNGRYWVLGAATTDVGYDLVVTDTTDGAEQVYSNPLGTVSPAIIDVEAFACAVP